MELNTPKYSGEQKSRDIAREDTLPIPATRGFASTGMLEAKTGNTEEGAIDTLDTARISAIEHSSDAIEAQDTLNVAAIERSDAIEARDTLSVAAIERDEALSILEHPTLPVQASHPTSTAISRGKALLGIAFLLILVFNAINLGYAQFIGPQGWAFVLSGPANAGDPNLLKSIRDKLHQQLTPGASATATAKLTPEQYINLIVQNMSLEQKLGQMMIVRFLGPTYSNDISAMVSQYDVGAVLLFSANNNIQDKVQLKGLIQQMQSNSAIPLAMSIDQEGGYVDRLVSLDGPRPSASSIGATNDPNKARSEGIQDAKDLATYGFNLNLAPVVDVNTVYNPQLYGRTFGTTADIVTRMAAAYLQGLQLSGKVFGTLKHFPGLGDVATDPHNGVPDVYRSLNDLQNIDWAPYRTLIQQGNIHAVMVTHDILHAVDGSTPSSLSYKVVTGILRNQLGFQGVILTDSLTMEGITAFYSESQAAALAVEAGCDLLMGASTPRDVASMIEGIKQAMNSGAISMQRIDDSVRRILMMKYELGLLTIPTN